MAVENLQAGLLQLNKDRSLGLHVSVTLPRVALICPRKTLLFTRCMRALKVGRVALRGFTGLAASATNSCNLAMASARLPSWLRELCALMTTTPSAVMRWSDSANNLSYTSSGSEDARMSKRKCTALDTLFTC